MSINPEMIAEIKTQLARIERLSAVGKSLADLHEEDPREWYRSLLRTFADIRRESDDMCRHLATSADAQKLLTAAQIADAGRISRAAIYKRRQKP